MPLESHTLTSSSSVDLPVVLREARHGHTEATGTLAGKTFAAWKQEPFRELTVTIDPTEYAVWCRMRPASRPSFTPPMLRDIGRVLQLLKEAKAENDSLPVDFLVLCSHTPGVFNLGGDLGLFHQCILNRDEADLRDYAYKCIDLVYTNHTGCDRRIVGISLLEGDALGGGFECALSSDIVIAERQARGGFPEILFNLFPGMGAYSLLTRRVGPAIADEMIRSGKIYTADELCEIGVIDQVVERGEGEEAVRQKMRSLRSRLRAHSALMDVRRRTNPLTLGELRDIADLWVATALALSPADLDRMGRIIAAQDRAVRGRNAGAHTVPC